MIIKMIIRVSSKDYSSNSQVINLLMRFSTKKPQEYLQVHQSVKSLILYYIEKE